MFGASALIRRNNNVGKNFALSCAAYGAMIGLNKRKCSLVQRIVETFFLFSYKFDSIVVSIDLDSFVARILYLK